MKSLDQKIQAIETDIERIIKPMTHEQFWVTHYGAVDIDPKHLVYRVCVQSDAEKSRLNNNQPLHDKLRELLTRHSYPARARENVFIGFESQETVDRESNGNWWYHWK